MIVSSVISSRALNDATSFAIGRKLEAALMHARYTSRARDAVTASIVSFWLIYRTNRISSRPDSLILFVI
jgi:hypothetical protein